jgi:hypothetical protein
MLNKVSYAGSEADIPAGSVSLLPTLPDILFPDFSNAQVTVPADAPATEQFIVDSSSKASWATA